MAQSAITQLAGGSGQRTEERMMNIEQGISNYELEAMTSSFRIPCSEFDIFE